MNKRNIILGIDGVPFKLMEDLSNKGIMPNFKELIKIFPFKKLKSSIPHVSSVSWSSIITGKNPGEHGIFGFSEIIKNTYSLRFPNFNALKSKAFWHQEVDKKHVLINVPSTYPAKELNGIHISGFVALDLEKAVYPKNYIPILKELQYEIDVDSKIAHLQSKDSFLNELFRVLNIRKNTFKYFWDEIRWYNFMAVITGSDRIGHFLWNVYEDNKNPYHHKFLDYFREIDNIIGFFVKNIKEHDTLIILSDHGMEKIFKNVNLNSYLEQEGFLYLSENLKKYNRIQKNSKAFILDSGRIYINKKGKYPNGSVTRDEEKKVIEELKESLIDLRFKKQKVLKKIYEKEELYEGKMLNNAPDLLVIENKGFNLIGAIGKKEIFESEKKFSGKHNEDSFILINKEIEIENLSVEDVVNLIR